MITQPLSPYLVLASSSPKRQEILNSLNLNFQIYDAKVKEITSSSSPHHLVKQNANLKVQATSHIHPYAFIIGADTIVTSGKNIFLKPENLREGIKMLNSYRHHPNYVYTGLSVYEPKRKTIITRVQKSRFHLTAMSPQRQELVFRTIFSSKQSGGFSIEGWGSVLLDKISGSYYNILGLPLHLLDKMFLDLGSDLRQFTKK